jgi:superoxide reductase
MKSRRNFLKTAVATSAGVAIASMPNAQAASGNYPGGIIYTSENPGIWEKKVKSHAPGVEVKDSKVTIFTNHGMTEKHYIVRHTLVTPEGDVVGEKTFSPNDEDAISHFELPSGHKKLIATSFCNKHDLWVTEFSV